VVARVYVVERHQLHPIGGAVTRSFDVGRLPASPLAQVILHLSKSTVGHIRLGLLSAVAVARYLGRGSVPDGRTLYFSAGVGARSRIYIAER
jgi:hypothetical protein